MGKIGVNCENSRDFAGKHKIIQLKLWVKYLWVSIISGVMSPLEHPAPACPFRRKIRRSGGAPCHHPPPCPSRPPPRGRGVGGGRTPPNNRIEVMGSIFGGFRHRRCRKATTACRFALAASRKKGGKTIEWLRHEGILVRNMYKRPPDEF